MFVDNWFFGEKVVLEFLLISSPDANCVFLFASSYVDVADWFWDGLDLLDLADWFEKDI